MSNVQVGPRCWNYWAISCSWINSNCSHCIYLLNICHSVSIVPFAVRFLISQYYCCHSVADVISHDDVYYHCCYRYWCYFIVIVVTVPFSQAWFRRQQVQNIFRQMPVSSTLFFLISTWQNLRVWTGTCATAILIQLLLCNSTLYVLTTDIMVLPSFINERHALQTCDTRLFPSLINTYTL